jgi:hypothetical protein
MRLPSLLLASLLLGCHADAGSTEDAAHHHDAHAGSAADPHAHASEGDVPHAHASEGEVDRDLVTVMRGLEDRMHALSGGLWRDDPTVVQRAAHGIAEHPHVGATDLARIQGALGDRFAGFLAADEATHDAAVAVAEAAQAGSTAGLMPAVATLQASCVACHDGFRRALTGR